MRRKRRPLAAASLGFAAASLALATMAVYPARAATIAGGVLTEDFITLEYADLSLPSSAVTTGVWETGAGRVRAHAFANGAAGSTRPIDFGNGADGAVSSSTGYTFDTDSHPSGFNFTSLTITGGAITVTGSHPLVIRSLGPVTITPAIDLSGANGSSGLSSGAAIPGPATPTCLARGGNGGLANATVGANGGDAIQSDGTAEGNGNEGVGYTPPGPPAYSAAIDGQGAIGAPTSNNFDLDATAFICGSGGPGGGGYTDGGTHFASGGAGGTGGGRVRIVAAGSLSVGAVNARGGDGGNGLGVIAGPQCSGNGSGGNGGAVWLQTLGDLTTGSNPDVTAGTSGTSPCFIGSSQSLFDGARRGDTRSTGARPPWAAGSYDTDVVPASLVSTVQSKAYPLGVTNAGFSAPTVTSTGTVAVEYAGSRDSVTFDAYVSDLTSLSNHDYRYVRWRATLTNPGTAGASPAITRIEIPYSDLGLSSVDLKLAAGCGSAVLADGSGPGSGGRPRPWGPADAGSAVLTALALLGLAMITRSFRSPIAIEENPHECKR